MRVPARRLAEEPARDPHRRFSPRSDPIVIRLAATISLRSIVGRRRVRLPRARRDQCRIVDERSTPRTNGSSQRTGIRQRYIAGRGRDHVDARGQGGRGGARRRRPQGRPTSISSSSPPRRPTIPFPPSRPQVQAALGIDRGRRLRPAGGLLRLRLRRRDRRQVPDAPARTSAALVIGAETFSRMLDWNDRTTCVLFGDGAGAVVLRGAHERRSARFARRSSPRACVPTAGIAIKLYVDGGPSTTRDGRPSAHGRARKCSVTPSAWSTDVIRDASPTPA